MSDHKETRDSRGSGLIDFYVDFLGSLVPGLFAIILAVTALEVSMSAALFSLAAPASTTAGQAKVLSFGQWLDFGLGMYGNAGILLVAAYVLGSVFYRQDPKTPDYRSARHVWRSAKEEDRGRLAVQPRNPEAHDIAEEDAQFPYFFLKEYLAGRGLGHLAQWVPWSGRDKDSWSRRTKMFINVLKIRLQYLVPERCKDIVRNEAHVRMATSVWYATNWILAAATLSFLFAFAAFVNYPNKLSDTTVTALSYDILVLVFAHILKTKIEKFIHYLRVRETVYVLETADFASRTGCDLCAEDFGVIICRAAKATSAAQNRPGALTAGVTDAPSR